MYEKNKKYLLTWFSQKKKLKNITWFSFWSRTVLRDLSWCLRLLVELYIMKSDKRLHLIFTGIEPKLDLVEIGYQFFFLIVRVFIKIWQFIEV